MEVMEKIAVPEPQWILDRKGSGPLFWRRDVTENNPRVRFRCDVEVKEFCRGDHELHDVEWPDDLQSPNTIAMGMTALLCVFVTVLLPWYIIGVN